MHTRRLIVNDAICSVYLKLAKILGHSISHHTHNITSQSCEVCELKYFGDIFTIDTHQTIMLHTFNVNSYLYVHYLPIKPQKKHEINSTIT